MDRRNFIIKVLAGLTAGSGVLINPVYGTINSVKDLIPVKACNSKTKQDLKKIINSPLKDFKVIEAHEHILNVSVLKKFNSAFKNNIIDKVICLGTPAQTLGTSRAKGFTEYDWNNDQTLKMVRLDPEKYIAFATYPPTDKQALHKFKEFLRQGGTGLKLYNGHSKIYPKFNLPIYCDEIHDLMAFCEQLQIPVCYHIKLRPFFAQTKKLMRQFPKLKVNIPHLGVNISWGHYKKYISYFLENYENVYTDVSFGNPEYADNFMRRISETRKEMRRFFIRHRQRILFGADMVITTSKKKSSQYVNQSIESYRSMLEKKAYYNWVSHEKYRRLRKKPPNRCLMYGLNLEDPVLRDIYENNPKRYLIHNYS